MNTTDSQVLPAPPSLIRALMAGFDAISNHISVILFPILLDLLLWLGPHLRLGRLINAFVGQVSALPELNTPGMSQVIRLDGEFWKLLAERTNLLNALRAYPVGIPSLMVSRLPASNPAGSPLGWEISSAGAVLGLWLALTLVGLVIGTLYFGVVAQAALAGKTDYRRALRLWPWSTVQVLSLALVWVGLLIAIGLPFLCLLSFLLVSGIGISRFVILLLGGMLVWLLLPLLLSPHGIFVNGRRMWVSLLEGARLTRLTLNSTGLLFLTIVVLSEGLDVLWRIPSENSWLALVGVAGHGFVTTGLLAATFIYYQDAQKWVHNLQHKAKFA